MARALECPACGARHRLDQLDGGSTFRCDRCGQALKVPASVSATRPPSSTASGAPAPDSSGAPPAPPPRRGGSAAGRGQTVTATAGGTAAAAAATTGVNGDAVPAPKSRADQRAARATGTPRTKVHWYWRLLAWIVAVPVGFVITAWPAFQLDLLKKSDLLDVFVGEGSGRYLRLLIGAAIWALATALLVQLFVEGGRWYSNRRRARKAAAANDDGGPRRQPQPVAGSAPRRPARAESA